MTLPQRIYVVEFPNGARAVYSEPPPLAAENRETALYGRIDLPTAIEAEPPTTAATPDAIADGRDGRIGGPVWGPAGHAPSFATQSPPLPPVITPTAQTRQPFRPGPSHPVIAPPAKGFTPPEPRAVPDNWPRYSSGCPHPVNRMMAFGSGGKCQDCLEEFPGFKP